MSADKIFNLIWVNYPQSYKNDNFDVSRASGETQSINNSSSVSAMIIYPTFLMPEIIWAEEKIELILLSERELSKDDVSNHLKFSPGFSSEKEYYSCNLYDKISKHDIKLTNFDISNSEIDSLDTSDNTSNYGRFAGIFAPHALASMKEYFLGQPTYHITIVSIDKKILDLFSENDTVEVHNTLINPSSDNKNDDYLQGQEDYDHYISSKMEELNSNGIKESGRWCFKIENNEINIAKVDKGNPIQSFHPIFYYNNLTETNMFVIGDVHVSSRQNILQRTNAKVIECDEINSNNAIGKSVNSCSKNFIDLLIKAGADDDVDVVLLAGDLVDYIKNIYTKKANSNKSKLLNAKDVWNCVELDEEYGKYYKDFVDFISIYSIILSFYKTYGKPVYVVSGNHDCYHEPYGISPRVGKIEIETPWGTKINTQVSRANGGIPADHNLTFYEAILAFGETYNKLLTGANSSFTPEKFDWFYTVFTPFSDFVIQLPQQALIGYGWGVNEDIKEYYEGQQFHLPRSEDSINNKQFHLYEKSLLQGKKQVILSHFTFASYTDSIEMNRNEQGSIPIKGLKDIDTSNFNDLEKGIFDLLIGEEGNENFHYIHDLGTFELNREKLYKDQILNSSNILCTLSGHSHRRGIYNVTDLASSFTAKIKDLKPAQNPDLLNEITREYSLPDFSSIENMEITVNIENVKTNYNDFNDVTEFDNTSIIVTDSAGSIPRYNARNKDFDGWGSTAASGTKVKFEMENSTCKINSVKSVEVNSKPRFIVAVDYWDILVDRVFKSFKFDEFDKGAEDNMGTHLHNFYNFRIRLNDNFPDDIQIEKIILFCYVGDSDNEILKPDDETNWRIIELEGSFNGLTWSVSGDNTDKIYTDSMIFRTIRKHRGDNEGNFISIKFTTTNNKYSSQYCFKDHWQRPFQIRTDGQEVHIEMHKDKAEIPNFEWRKSFDSNKYGT